MRPGGVEFVVLGALAMRPLTGYEIKQLVDTSTRYFWAASYGQIYPELRRLEEAGLVESEPDPQGGRRRNRYTLTESGRDRLRDWLHDPACGCEWRDEGLLKLFFARALDGDGQLEVVRALLADREAVLEQLRAIERMDIARETGKLVLDLGLRWHGEQVESLQELERRLATRLEVPS
jgi:PadR family transcriptional regulator, regulatory protein AphA